MSWAEGFYWGQSKLECRSYLPTDEGKTVKITNGAMTWTQVLGESLTAKFTLPGTNKYNVSLMGEGDEPEYTEDILLGYGEYKAMQIGYDKTTIQGIQSILNAHKEMEMLDIGDEVTIILSGDIEMVYQVGCIDSPYAKDGHDVIMVSKWLYPNTEIMNTSQSNSGGFNRMTLYSQLQDSYFNMFPDEVKKLMVETTQITSQGNKSLEIQQTIGNIFLPTEWEVFGKCTYAAEKEHIIGNTIQWPIFATAGNRIRTLGKDGKATRYWTCSPNSSSSSDFCTVQVDGSEGTVYGNVASTGVPLCFRLEAQM